MNVWPLFIAAGRLSVIWIKNPAARKIALTVVTLSFVGYHLKNEKDKMKRAEQMKEYGNS